MSGSIKELARAAAAGLGLALMALAPASAQQPAQSEQPAAAPKKARGQGEAKKSKAAQPAPEAGEQAGAGDGGVDPEAALDKARKVLAEGKPDVARSLAAAVLASPRKDARNTARALAVRGEVSVRQGRPADAIADLDNALWVKGGLAGAEREAATKARALAMQQSGLESPAAPGGAVEARAQTAAPPAVPREARTEEAWKTRVATRPPEATATAARPAAAAPPAAAGSDTGSGAIGKFFSNLFSGRTAGSPGAVPETTGTVPKPAAALSSSEPQRTEPQRAEEAARPRTVQPPRAAPAKAAAATVAPAAAPAVKGDGRYLLQLGAVRDRAAAEELSKKVRREHAGALASRTFEVEEAVYGNMGRFYRVRIGRFEAPTEAQAVCASIRNGGVDCMVSEQ